MKKLLEIVLALGNYMNRGQRGNAKGFLISSLNNMVDTKSSLNRHVTLLHYLVEVLEKRVSINFVTNTKCFLFFVRTEFHGRDVQTKYNAVPLYRHILGPLE